MSNEIQKIEPEIIVMRPIGGSKNQSNNTWSPWALFGIIVGAIVVGNIIWWWSAKTYAEYQLTILTEQLAKEAKEQEKRDHEADLAKIQKEQLNSQRQEAENARIAWEYYNLEQQRQEEERQRNFVLAQQRQWQSLNNQNHGVTYNIDTRQTAEEIKAENCKSWINSNIADPSHDKKKYIKENCS